MAAHGTPGTPGTPGDIIDMAEWETRVVTPGALQYPFQHLRPGDGFRSPPARSDIGNIALAMRQFCKKWPAKRFQMTQESDGRVLVMRIA